MERVGSPPAPSTSFDLFVQHVARKGNKNGVTPGGAAPKIFLSKDKKFLGADQAAGPGHVFYHLTDS
jgi:hypothetical protein